MDALMDLAETAREVAPLIRTLRELCGEDEQAFLDTLEGESDVTEAARRVVRWMIEQDAAALSCKGLAGIYEARASMFAERHMKAKGALLDLLNELGVKSMPLPEASLTAKATPPRVVGEADAANLPDNLRRTTYAPDKAAIKAALERGETVEGFTLSNGGQSLQVRVR
jgi:hypothetical protein